MTSLHYRNPTLTTMTLFHYHNPAPFSKPCPFSPFRALLTESHHAAEAQLTELTAKLEAYKALGPEFRDLALELGQIRHETARKRQTLSQLCPTSSSCNQAQ